MGSNNQYEYHLMVAIINQSVQEHTWYYHVSIKPTVSYSVSLLLLDMTRPTYVYVERQPGLWPLRWHNLGQWKWPWPRLLFLVEIGHWRSIASEASLIQLVGDKSKTKIHFQRSFHAQNPQVDWVDNRQSCGYFNMASYTVAENHWRETTIVGTHKLLNPKISALVGLNRYISHTRNLLNFHQPRIEMEHMPMRLMSAHTFT